MKESGERPESTSFRLLPSTKKGFHVWTLENDLNVGDALDTLMRWFLKQDQSEKRQIMGLPDTRKQRPGRP